MKIIIALLIFSFIILFHELGHFLMARLCGVFVEEFSLGLGPRLLSFQSKKSLTRYSLKLLPFGGSCAMKGEFGYGEEEGSFGAATVLQRMLIVAGGPVFNFILAFVGAAIIISSAGIDYPYVYCADGYPAAEAGMENGDMLISLGGEKINIYRDYVAFVELNQKKLSTGSPVELSFMRDGTKMSAEVVFKDNGYGHYILGVAGGARYAVKNPFKILGYSFYELRFWIRTTLSSLKMLLTGRLSPDTISGPVGVVSMIGDTYEETKSEGIGILILNMVNMLVLISANLGIMNLLPFPALDGGRLVLLVIEALRRKKLGESIEGYINIAGLALLMCLMFLILFQDIHKLLVV